MGTEDDTEARGELLCRVAEVRRHSVLLDPGEERARFLLPLDLVPGEVEVGDGVGVRARQARLASPAAAENHGTDVDEIFDEALEALQDIESGWGRPGTPADSSAA
jgi:hypothetical protein